MSDKPSTSIRLLKGAGILALAILFSLLTGCGQLQAIFAPTGTPTLTLTPTQSPTNTPLPPTATPTETSTPTFTPDLTKVYLETQIVSIAQTQSVQLTNDALATIIARTARATSPPPSRFTSTPEGTPPATVGPPFTVLEISSPFKLGKVATARIQTDPGVFCYLSYWTASGRISTADGVGGTTADSNGVCTWTWTISDKESTGTATIAIGANGYNQAFLIEVIDE